jgi:predicted metal-dependent phosphoesterase TrpH
MRIDLHVHTRRHSACSFIDPAALIPTAIQSGLNGVVITEHEYQWTDEELDRLRAEAGTPGFFVAAGFEYHSTRGDVLIYGLPHDACRDFAPGMTPGEVTARADALGGVCIAAHPTREGKDFDLALAECRMTALEVCSTNLRDHERRLAINLAKALGIPPMAASDAHTLTDIGRFATEFDVVIDSMQGLQNALQDGRFRVSGNIAAELEIL